MGAAAVAAIAGSFGGAAVLRLTVDRAMRDEVGRLRQELREEHAYVAEVAKVQTDVDVEFLQLAKNQQAAAEQYVAQQQWDVPPPVVDAGVPDAKPQAVHWSAPPKDPGAVDNPYAALKADLGLEDKAFLNVNSIPPTQAFVDGKLLGTTPREHYAVPPGVHTVSFFDGRRGLARTLTVTLVKGETKLAAVKFQPATPQDGF
jgi:hypothetical protein